MKSKYEEVKEILGKYNQEQLLVNYDKLKQSLVLLGVAVILMAIAGVIEVYLTVPIANFILSIFG